MSEDGTEPAPRRGRFSPGRSGNPVGRKRLDAAPSAPTTPIGRSRHDADWINYFTGQGVPGRDKRLGAHFNVSPLSFDQLMHLWLGDDLAARAVETIPKEAMRQGYDLTVSDAQEGTDEDTDGLDPSEAAAKVLDELERLGADDALEVAASYERGYGGGAILIGANDKQADLTKPLDLRQVTSLDYLNPLEARECMPTYAYGDPRAPKYGQPEIYRIMTRSVLPSRTSFSAQTMEVHESRLLVFPGIRVSRFQPLVARGGWGEAVLTRIYRVLRDFNAAYGNAGVLINDFSQAVIKIAGLWESLAADGDQAFENRLAAMDRGRSAINAIAIDAGDSFERQSTPVAGLSDLLEKFSVRLAAACDMPLTLLFGTSPAGMNATGESDIRFFYDRVASYQQRKILPRLRQICKIIFRTIGSKREPEKWSIKFRPLWQESAKDKASAMLTQAQADSAWITAQVLSPEEVAKAHWGKGEYDPTISVDFAARDAQEAAAAAPVTADDRAAMTEKPDDYVPPPGPGTADPQPDIAPPGAPAAVDPSTPPVRTIAAEDSATARRRDEWSEADHPRGEDGKFGEGSGGGGREVSAERVAASLKDKDFVTKNMARLSRAADASIAHIPADDTSARASDAAHETRMKAIDSEAARVLRENDAIGDDKKLAERVGDVHYFAKAKSPEEAHAAAMEVVAEHKADLAKQAEARTAGLVPAVPSAAFEKLQAEQAKHDLDGLHKDLDESQTKALQSLADLSAYDEEAPGVFGLASEYGAAADHLGAERGHDEDSGEARYSAIEGRPGVELPEPHEDIAGHIDEETGKVAPWSEAVESWREDHEAASDERWSETFEERGFDKLGLNSDDRADKVPAWDEDESELSHEDYKSLAAECESAFATHEARYKADEKEAKTRYESLAADYQKQRDAHDEHKTKAALAAQDQLEALHEKQVKALAAVKLADKKLTPLRDKAEAELSEDDAGERVRQHPVFAGIDENEESADPGEQRRYEGARSAHEADLQSARESRIPETTRHGEETQEALQDAIKVTTGTIRELAAITGRKASLYKPAKGRADEWEESQHPRGEDGKFGEGGGSSGGGGNSSGGAGGGGAPSAKGAGHAAEGGVKHTGGNELTTTGTGGQDRPAKPEHGVDRIRTAETSEPKRGGDLIDAIGNGGIRSEQGRLLGLNDKAQATVRGYFDDLAAQHGMSLKEGQAEAHVLLSRSAADMGGALGLRYGNGKIEMADAGMAHLGYHAQDHAYDPKTATSESGINAYGTLMHETIHSHGPTIPLDLTKPARQQLAEEMSTEMAARIITDKVHGLTAGQHPYNGYSDIMDEAVGHVAGVTGLDHNAAHEILGQAAVSFKNMSGTIEPDAALRYMAENAVQRAEHKAGTLVDNSIAARARRAVAVDTLQENFQDLAAEMNRRYPWP